MFVLNVGMEALVQTDLHEGDGGAEENDRTGDEENVLQDACAESPGPTYMVSSSFRQLESTQRIG